MHDEYKKTCYAFIYQHIIDSIYILLQYYTLRIHGLMHINSMHIGKKTTYI